ncbi:hypothetical protein AB0J28_15460 [Streptosporangium canum]|uniref:hypothetical protein n=1 Tax=Streptosporangium canum TaxID=324952 RepID=UPI003417779D
MTKTFPHELAAEQCLGCAYGTLPLAPSLRRHRWLAGGEHPVDGVPVAMKKFPTK